MMLFEPLLPVAGSRPPPRVVVVALAIVVDVVELVDVVEPGFVVDVVVDPGSVVDVDVDVDVVDGIVVDVVVVEDVVVVVVVVVVLVVVVVAGGICRSTTSTPVTSPLLASAGRLLAPTTS